MAYLLDTTAAATAFATESTIAFQKHQKQNRCHYHRINTLFTLICTIVFLVLDSSTAFFLVRAYTNNNNNNNSNSHSNTKAHLTMRAWTCHGKTQKDLVDKLRQANIIKSPFVQQVMEQVDRANYIPQDPYIDAPQTIGYGQTISAPHMHAYVLEEMVPYLQNQQPKDTIKILDVGCGSGYLTATLGRWLQSKPKDNITNDNDNTNTGDSTSSNGRNSCILFPNPAHRPSLVKVFGIDVHQPLIDLTISNIQKEDNDLLQSGMITLQLRDGWKGWPTEAPFDIIHVGAAADSLPQALASQLKVGGILIIPIGPNGQEQKLYKIERVSSLGTTNENENDKTTITTQDNDKQNYEDYNPKDYRISVLLGVRYVPLVKHPEL